MKRSTKFSLPTLGLVVIALALSAGLFWYSQKQESQESMVRENTVATREKVASTDSVQPTKTPTDSQHTVPSVTQDDHIQGSAEADVVLIEYSDFDCPFCKNFHNTVKELESIYGDRFSWVYRHYPLMAHPNAPFKAQMSECVARVGGNDAFWKYADSLFANTRLRSQAELLNLASEQGVDTEKVRSCIQNRETADRVAADKDAGDAIGIRATPTSYLVSKDGEVKPIVGALPLETMRQAIDEFLR